MKLRHLCPTYVLSALALLSVALPCRADIVALPNGYSLGPLAELRDEITFPEFSNEQKQVLASQSRILLEELYVNKHLKENLYGPSAALGDRMAVLEQAATTMSTEELELAISRVWNSQRDGHLNFFFPKPYACYASLMPFTLVEVFAPSAEHSIVVKSLRSFASSLDAVPAIGDELIAYDGMPIEDAIEEQIKTYGGSNNSGGYARALYTLTVRDHRFHLVPDMDDVELTFRTPQGDTYTIFAPWMTQRDDWCTTPPGGKSNMADGLFEVDETSATSEDLLTSNDELPREESAAGDSLNEYLLLCADIESTYAMPATSAGFALIPTSIADISYALVENRYGTFGYLKLGTFMTTGTQADAAFVLIRDLLTTKLRDTRGLILDLRGNPGGIIELADRLPQLFARRDIQVEGARVLNTPLNVQVLNNSALGTGLNQQWSTVINEVAGSAALYSKTATFTTTARANDTGQAYFGPVAVLTNALTYSAAEHFAAVMQDERLATIWGEDLKTGGGGANVMEHASFVRYVGAPFVSLPGGQILRVAWRHFVRTGRSAGMILEDQGVVSDRRVRLTLDELLTGKPVQFDSISSDLAYLAGSGFASIYFDAPRQVETSIDALAIFATVAHTDEIQLWMNGAMVSKQRVLIREPKSLQIPLPTAGIKIGETLDFELRGLKYAGQAWRVKKQLTVLGHMVNVPASGYDIDFATATTLEPMTILNIKPWINSTPENGWRLRNGKLGIGDGVQYKRNVKSDASLMLDLTGRTKASLEVTADVQTEKKYDYVDVYVTAGNDPVLLKRWTGKLPTATYTYDLSMVAGQKNVGLHFLFYSDGLGTDRGVEISKIRLF